jgi:L-fucose mutarotase/ribose pyranase (RbsD/FucU family)
MNMDISYTMNLWKIDTQLLVYSFLSAMDIIKPIISLFKYEDELHVMEVISTIKNMADSIVNITDISLADITTGLFSIYSLDNILYKMREILQIFQQDSTRDKIKLTLISRDRKEFDEIIILINERFNIITTRSKTFIQTLVDSFDKKDLENIPEKIFKTFHKNKSYLVSKFLILILIKLGNENYVEYYKDAIFIDSTKNENTHTILSTGLTFGLFPLYNKVDIKTIDKTRLMILNNTIFSSNLIVEYR